MTEPRLERLYALHNAAKEIADPESELGREARERLGATSGLSPAGVALALEKHLEHGVGRRNLADLLRRVPPAKRSHVLLSANVFTGAFRAIALGLAQSERVSVRTSRRSPVFAELLHRGSNEAFELVPQLSPAPGDHVWIYGTDATISDYSKTLPGGVVVHAHGSGMGAVAIQAPTQMKESALVELAGAIAADVVPFDQRGCLSPRVVLLEGPQSFAEQLKLALAEALFRAEEVIPRGTLNDDEQAEAKRYEQTMHYVGGAEIAGSGLVTLDPVRNRLYIPPVGRYLHLSIVDSAVESVKDLGRRLTSVAVYGNETFAARISAQLPGRRIVDPGQMQTPPLDGPVDGRNDVYAS